MALFATQRAPTMQQQQQAPFQPHQNTMSPTGLQQQQSFNQFADFSALGGGFDSQFHSAHHNQAQPAHGMGGAGMPDLFSMAPPVNTAPPPPLQNFFGASMPMSVPVTQVPASGMPAATKGGGGGGLSGLDDLLDHFKM